MKPATLNRQKFLILVVAASAIILAWLLLFPRAASSRAEMMVGGRTIHLEIAETAEAEMRGLGGRTSLAPDWGMLFLFKSEGLYPFWMKGMKFPIDIIWINHGTVTEIATLYPPSSPSDPPQEYTPTKSADRVLELNAGMAAELGIVPGVLLELPR